MPAQTSRLRLIYHTLADAFRIQDYADNWQILNDNPGVFICTSATRPDDWTSFDDGRLIFETDTRELWAYNHSVPGFERAENPASERDADTNVNIASDTYVTVVEDTIEASGSRPILITVTGDVSLVSVPADLRIYDGAAALLEWTVQPSRRAYTIVLTAPSAGTYDIDIGGDTAVIAYDDTEVEMQAALNAIPGFVGTVVESSGDYIVSYVGHLPLIVDDSSLTGTAVASVIPLEHPTEVLAVMLVDTPNAGSVTYSFQAHRAETAGSVDFDTAQIDIVEL